MASYDIFKPDYTRFISPWAPHPILDKHRPQPGPVYSSPWGPFPEVPHDINVHEISFPPNNPLPEDYDLFINAVTEQRVTLHQFYARCKALARALRYDGPNPVGLGKSPVDDKEPGEILGLFSRNHIHYSSLPHACFRAELVFGGISPASTPFELWWVLRKMQITSMVVHESLLDVVRQAAKMGPGEGDEGKRLVLDMRKIIVLSDDPNLDVVEDYPTVDSLVRLGEKMQETNRKLFGGHKLCFLFQSSGTSGLPKAMMVTHYNAAHTAIQTLVVATQIAIFNKMTPLTPQTVLGVVPAYHSYGMILWVLRLNLCKFTNILLPKWDLELALRSIQKYRITHLPLVPPIVRQLAQSPLTEKYDLSSVISCSSGAAYLPNDVAYELARKLPQGASKPVLTGLGLSEAAGVSAAMPSPLFGVEPSKPGTLGFLSVGMQARFVDPDTLKDVKKGEVGELWVRGNVVIPGYYREPEANREIFTEPRWLRTGDIMRINEHDQLVYVERMKELIKVKGLQVAATEVEDTLLDHPEKLVKDACVAGVENGRGDGSVFVRAWVVLTDAGKRLEPGKLEETLKQLIEQRLSKHKWLTGGIEVVDSVGCD